MQPYSVSKEPVNKNNSRRNLIFTKSWRDGFQQILEKDKLSINRVLIPAYIGLSLEEGSGVFDPIRSTKSDYTFYEVDMNLNPVISDLTNKIIHFQPTHIVIINYFGWIISNRKEINKLIRQNSNAKIIEDWAHDMTPFYNREIIDHLADYELYSAHKLLPVEDGGICFTSESNHGLSESAKIYNLRDIICYNFDEISANRNKNYVYLKKSLSGNKNIQIMFENASQKMLTPLNFPITFRSKEERHEAYSKMIGKNIYPTSLYHRLIPEIEISEYPNSFAVSNTILNLPIHQDVRKDDLDKIIGILEYE
jgi:dTDP-4-amino-4,6-dideoxygalactose transaminase